MKILIIAKVDHTGAGYALMQAINKHTEHEARAMSFKRTWLQYPYDILKPPGDVLRSQIIWADVLNVHDDGWSMLTAHKTVRRPVVTTYHGSWYRQSYRMANSQAKVHGWAQTCLTMDLTVYGNAIWLGRPMADMSYMHRPAVNIFKVAHSPSQAGRKGTDIIRQALASLEGVELEIIERIPNVVCLERKARANLLVDQIGPRALGHGTSALEAWAIGMPVISMAQPQLLELMTSLVGYIPFCHAYSESRLANHVERMRDDPKFRQAWRAIGRDYLFEYHDPAKVARRFVEVCESVR